MKQPFHRNDVKRVSTKFDESLPTDSPALSPVPSMLIITKLPTDSPVPSSNPSKSTIHQRLERPTTPPPWHSTLHTIKEENWKETRLIKRFNDDGI